MRPSPRTLLLRALETAPMERWILAHTLHEEGPWLFEELEPLLDRHLCKLLRSRRVVRLTDGRYSLRLYEPTPRNLAAGRPLRPYALTSSGPVQSLTPPGVPEWADQVVGLMKEPRPAPHTYERVSFKGITIPAGTLQPGDRIEISGTISVRRQSPEADTFSFKVVAKEDIDAGAAVVIDPDGTARAWKG